MARRVPVRPASVLAGGSSARRVLIDDGPPSHLFCIFHACDAHTHIRARVRAAFINSPFTWKK
nr:MAG TPA: hypothetical protein [Caudoviricetes sp.]